MDYAPALSDTDHYEKAPQQMKSPTDCPNLPMKGTPKHYLYRAIWIWIQCSFWLIATATITNAYYPRGTESRDTTFGILVRDHEQLRLTKLLVIYAALLILFNALLITSRWRLKQGLTALQRFTKQDTDPLSIAKVAHSIFPSYTRLVVHEEGSTLFIGTCHLSALSAFQSAEIVKAVKPDAIVVELDKARAHILYPELRAKVSPELSLIRDLFQWATYLNPLAVIIRMGSQMLPSPVSSGQEFKDSVDAASSSKKDCRIVFGDRNCHDTLRAIGDATPWALVVVIDLLMGLGYIVPAVWATGNVTMMVTECLYHQQFLILGARLLLVLAFGIPWYFMMRAVPQLFWEIWKLWPAGSAEGDQERSSNVLLNAGASRLLKDAREEFMAERIVEAMQSEAEEHQMVICVTGLAHLDDVPRMLEGKLAGQVAGGDL